MESKLHFDSIDELNSLDTLLLDKDHRIVLDRDSDSVFDDWFQL
jgi:hypothetical protein